MALFIAIAGLALLILVHELGHFLAAKSVGLRATKFYIGFPPALFKVQRGDTTYALGAIPLGGYVRIVGMVRPRPRDILSVKDAAEQSRSGLAEGEEDRLGDAYARLVAAVEREQIDAIGPLVSETQAALAAEADRIDPERARWAAKELTRLGEEVDPGAYFRAPIWKRMWAIFAGPFANVIAAFAILGFFYVGDVPRFDTTTSVELVTGSSPAAGAGLQSGDRIVAVDGKPVESTEEVRAQIQDGGPVVLTVVRDGARVVLPAATPQKTDVCDACLGFQFDIARVGTDHYGPLEALSMAWEEMRFTTTETFKALKTAVVGGDAENFTTPVGIVDQSADLVDEGVYPRLLALISLSLAIFNLLPFLPLDGGHLLFAAIEGIRRRPVRRESYERASAIGIAAMLALFAIGLSNDVGRITSGPNP